MNDLSENLKLNPKGSKIEDLRTEVKNGNVDQLFSLIRDYQYPSDLMSTSRIQSWLNQFNDSDQQILLDELNFILPKRYFSFDQTKFTLISLFISTSEKYGYSNPVDFFDHSLFIESQPVHKSQRFLINIIQNWFIEEYSTDIRNRPKKQIRYFLYIDDFLFTGYSFYRDISNFVTDKRISFDRMFENGQKLITMFLAVHTLGVGKVLRRIKYNSINNPSHMIDFIFRDKIENNLSDPYSQLNFVLPKRSVLLPDILCDLFDMPNKNKIYFRPEDHPIEETFFSSPLNRDLFEKIIFEKSFELYQTSKEKYNFRNRPLGCGLVSENPIGFGGLNITFRNVPLTTPLVFWFQSQDWLPLFERKLTTSLI